MIETKRLVLRDWTDQDRAAFHAMNSDPRVMATIGPPQTRDEADAVIGDMRAKNREGPGLWAIERRADRRMLGFCGIGRAPAASPVEGELEIGWRLVHDAWGQGYAREAAEASLAWAWTHTVRAKIVAITTPGNVRSWGLMKRIGMTRVADGDFDHPALAEGDPLRRHLTYTIERPR